MVLAQLTDPIVVDPGLGGSPAKAASAEPTNDTNGGAALCDAGAEAGAAGDTAGDEGGGGEEGGKAAAKKKSKKGEDGKAPADFFPY